MITRDEMYQVRYNPNLMQLKILNNLENYKDGDLTISDPTNPFNMLLEAAVTTSANSLLEIESIIRKKYPSLAIMHEDLYHHLSDKELTNMFAIPSEGNLYFYVNILDLKLNGYRPDGANYVETTIPEDTEISVLGTTLTLLNDIVIKLYDNDSIFVEQQAGSTDIAYQDVGIIPSVRFSSRTENVNWILFEVKVKQVKKTSVKTAITASKGFSLDMGIKGYYTFSNIIAGTATNPRYLSKSHTDDFIDPTSPTCYIKVMGKNVNFTIPDLYINNFGIDGNITIDVYETDGKIYLPIHKYKPDEFAIKLGNTGKNRSASTSPNIAILANSRSVLEGGKNETTVDELRESIINNTTGNIDLPITDLQLKRYNEVNGYKLFKVNDVITNRLYIAAKSLPEVKQGLLSAKQDVYFNTCAFVLKDIENNYNVTIENDYFIIKSNSIFRYENGTYHILDKNEADILKNMNHIDLITHMKDNIYYFNPYYYIIRKDSSYSYSSIYDLDNPTLPSLKIVNKNTTVNQKSNIDKYAIMKTNEGYRIVFTIATNEDFNSIPISNIRIQFKLPLIGVNSFNYFQAVRDESTGYWYCDIKSNHTLDDDSTLDVLNGESDLFNRRFAIENNITVYTYTVDPNVTDPTGYMVDELWNYPSENSKVVFSKESLTVNFGYKLEYIWNSLYNTFTDRKYKRYTEDIPGFYKEDVYEVFEETGGIYKCEVVGGVKKIIQNRLHRAGDPMLDKEGNQILLHKEGDIVLVDGTPVIDEYSGVVRYIDIMMMEYSFKVTTSNAYKQYMKLSLETLHKYLNEDMVDINNKLLDNTKVLYKSFKSNKNVLVSINNIRYSLPYEIAPSITLYVNSDVLSSDEVNKFTDMCGFIIDKHLTYKKISLADIRKDIQISIGSLVSAVKVEGIDSNNSEVITIINDDNRLSLKKKLDVDKNNQLVVKYDIKLNIQYV